VSILLDGLQYTIFFFFILNYLTVQLNSLVDELLMIQSPSSQLKNEKEKKG